MDMISKYSFFFFFFFFFFDKFNLLSTRVPLRHSKHKYQFYFYKPLFEAVVDNFITFCEIHCLLSAPFLHIDVNWGCRNLLTKEEVRSWKDILYLAKMFKINNQTMSKTSTMFSLKFDRKIHS